MGSHITFPNENNFLISNSSSDHYYKNNNDDDTKDINKLNNFKQI